MVAQRKATSTTTTKRHRAVQRRQASSDSDDPAAAGELTRLRAMRADALAWVAEIERRIEDIEARQAAMSL